MTLVTDLLKPVARLGAAAQNALEVARFGGLETDEEPSPYDVVAQQSVYRLLRYFPDDPTGGPPVILVPPMMLAAEVYDVAPAASAVATLRANGADPWVVDFGAPDKMAGGLERDLADHVLAVSDAVDRVRTAAGRDVHLGGYSQGGMFCYQAAAYRRSDGLASLVTFGSPVDTRGAIPFGIPERAISTLGGLLADTVGRQALPAWASRLGFRLLDPVKSVRQQIEFMLQLHDREALLPRERQRRFLQGEGWVAWPGPALADFMRQFVVVNRMLSGGFVVNERLVTLADISCPILTFVGEVDEIAPAPAVRAIVQAAPRAEVFEVPLRAGHFGLVVGSAATRTTWPTVAGWARWRDGEAQQPETVVRPPQAGAASHAPGVTERVGHGLALAADVGVRLAGQAAGTGDRAVRTARAMTREAARQIPRLMQLDQLQANTRMSLGLLLDQRARHAPRDVCFLFEGRAHTNVAVNGRVDAIVRGLISVGVHPGQHVGVLMATRPTALAVTAALNRLGAVVVLLRPDGDTAREAELGGVVRIIADPEHAATAAAIGPVDTFVLGGGGEDRDLGLGGVMDMERIEPGDVPVPAWYAANPGQARDLAFILFTGEGPGTRVNRITNRRWALSAFGTASAANLSAADTVYSVTPVHHPSGLLMSIGGAIVGDARLAMATEFEPGTFWDEVRRYGVTVTSYTWTMLDELVQAPPDPGERHHPVRLFIGSGMPRGLWRRVLERFGPARVLEFYVSTEGEAILVNLTGAKPGALGRPLPGSADVRIAAYDTDREQLIELPNGFVRECEVDEPGLLLARAAPEAVAATTPLRGVFARGDAWLATGDLFRRDADGDHWLVDNTRSLVGTAGGRVPALPSATALGDLPAVRLAVSYPITRDGEQIVAAAVALRPGATITAMELAAAVAGLPPEQRPAVVRLVDGIPVTTWYRPLTDSLRAAGVPRPDQGQTWYLDVTGSRYRPLTDAAHRRLVGAQSESRRDAVQAAGASS